MTRGPPGPSGRSATRAASSCRWSSSPDARLAGHPPAAPATACAPAAITKVRLGVLRRPARDRRTSGPSLAYPARRSTFTAAPLELAHRHDRRHDRLADGLLGAERCRLRRGPDPRRRPGDLDAAAPDGPAQRSAAPPATTAPLVILLHRLRAATVPPRTDPELSMSRTFTLPSPRTFQVSGTARLSTLVPDATIDALVGRGRGRATTSSPRAARRRSPAPSRTARGPPSTATRRRRGRRPSSPRARPRCRPRSRARRRLDEVDAALRQRRPAQPAVGPAHHDDRAAHVLVTIPKVPVATLHTKQGTVALTVAALRPVARRRRSPLVPGRAHRDDGRPRLRPPDRAADRDRGADDAGRQPGRHAGAAPRDGATRTSSRSTARTSPCGSPARRATRSSRARRRSRAAARRCASLQGRTSSRPPRAIAPDGTSTPWRSRSGPTGAGSVAPTARVSHVAWTSPVALHGTLSAQSRPSWLVLNQSFSRGWRASVDGHDLGAPVLLDGGFTAWRLGATPNGATVSITWAPQSTVDLALLLSLLGLVAVAVLIVIGGRRRRRREDPELDARTARALVALARARAPSLVLAAVATIALDGHRRPRRRAAARPPARTRLVAAVPAGAPRARPRGDARPRRPLRGRPAAQVRLAAQHPVADALRPRQHARVGRAGAARGRRRGLRPRRPGRAGAATRPTPGHRGDGQRCTRRRPAPAPATTDGAGLARVFADAAAQLGGAARDRRGSPTTRTTTAPTARSSRCPPAGLARSFALLKAFRKEQEDPDLFYRTIALDTLHRLTGSTPLFNRTVVDVGGGAGYFAEAFRDAGARVVLVEPEGADPIPEPAGPRRREHRRRTSATSARSGPAGSCPGTTIAGDGLALPLPDEVADFVFSSNVLEHVADPARFIDEAVRVHARAARSTCPSPCGTPRGAVTRPRRGTSSPGATRCAATRRSTATRRRTSSTSPSSRSARDGPQARRHRATTSRSSPPSPATTRVGEVDRARPRAPRARHLEPGRALGEALGDAVRGALVEERRACRGARRARARSATR